MAFPLQPNRELDLDERAIADAELEVFDPKSGSHTTPETVEVFIRKILRQALQDRASALNLFYDGEDDCLRALEYLDPPPGQAGADWREFLPAPGYLFEPVQQAFQAMLVESHADSPTAIRFRYLGESREAEVELHSGREIRVYFTSERPTMRRKGCG